MPQAEHSCDAPPLPGTQAEVLRELQANMPDSGELEALHAYLDSGGDPTQLGRAEQLFVALRHVARLPQKLQVRRPRGAGAW